MKKRIFTKSFLAVAMALLCCGEAKAGDKAEPANKVTGSEKNVAQEILDILRANNQITAQQYDTLLAKTKAEEAKQRDGGKKTPNAMQVYWKDGLNFDGGDDAKFKMQIGGYLMSDWAYVDGDKDISTTFGKSGSGAQFRRARLSVAGSLYEWLDYKVEYDFASGQSKIQDAYVQFNQVPWVGSVKLGHFKEPFSLTEATSARNITFIERATIKDAFIPSRNMGIMIGDHAFNKRMTWALGGFREADDQGKGFGSDSQHNLTMRLTGLPWYEEQGRKLVHLGLSYSHKFRNNDKLSFSARPEVNFTSKFVDTKDIVSDGVDLINPELALVYGPFSFQTEYTKALVSTPKGSGFDFSGYYLEASYFLTGEHRNYKDTAGTFAAVKPKHNFDGQSGWGAWEIATRYSSLNLDDSTVRGGKLSGFTTGLNWYLNPNLRIMANFSLAHRNTIGDASIFQMRAQVAF